MSVGVKAKEAVSRGRRSNWGWCRRKKTAKKKSLLDTRLTPLGFVRQGERERKEKERDHCWERTPNSVNHCLTATKGGGRGGRGCFVSGRRGRGCECSVCEGRLAEASDTWPRCSCSFQLIHSACSLLLSKISSMLVPQAPPPPGSQASPHHFAPFCWT